MYMYCPGACLACHTLRLQTPQGNTQVEEQTHRKVYYLNNVHTRFTSTETVAWDPDRTRKSVQGTFQGTKELLIITTRRNVAGL